MLVYIDNDYKCHVNAADGLREMDVSFFDGKCPLFVEGYRYIPPGESWTRADGVVFSVEMISSWKDLSILQAYQTQYEIQRAEIEDMQTALKTLGVTVDG